MDLTTVTRFACPECDVSIPLTRHPSGAVAPPGDAETIPDRVVVSDDQSVGVRCSACGTEMDRGEVERKPNRDVQVLRRLRDLESRIDDLHAENPDNEVARTRLEMLEKRRRALREQLSDQARAVAAEH